MRDDSLTDGWRRLFYAEIWLILATCTYWALWPAHYFRATFGLAAPDHAHYVLLQQLAAAVCCGYVWFYGRLLTGGPVPTRVFRALQEAMAIGDLLILVWSVYIAAYLSPAPAMLVAQALLAAFWLGARVLYLTRTSSDAAEPRAPGFFARARWPRVVTALFIVPDAHTRLFDVSYQADLYDAFHQSRLARTLHAVCATPIVLGMFTLLAMLPFDGGALSELFPIATRLGGAALLCALLVGLTLWVEWTVGLVAAPAWIGLGVGGNLLAEVLGASAWPWVILAMVAFAAAQALSHSAEPIPPPHSGSAGFVPFSQWWRSASLARRATTFALFPVFTMLELFSSPKLIPLQLLRALHALGYRPLLHAQTKQRSARIIGSGTYHQV